MPSGVVFVHNNFPAQFADLARTLVARGVPCAAIGQQHAAVLPGVRTARYRLTRGTTEGIYPLAVRAEADLIRARHALDAARALKDEGWDPQVIVGHPGWGEMSFLADLWPAAKRVAFAEFYYHGRGYDVGFDTEFFPFEPEAVFRAQAKNAVMALAYAEADAIVAPTAFQAGALPPAFRAIAQVIHEGVDTEAIRPGQAEPFVVDETRTILPGTPVITHVNNHMEPLRGLHILARALPRLLAEIPDAQIILIGDPRKQAYGGAPPGGGTWQDVCFEGVAIDPARVHFLGRVPHDRMLAALRLSTAHVYYTYPFVLSWSLAEAMASGCYVIGSDTPPLHDAIEDGVNGRLLPFFDVEALSDALIAACRDPASVAPMRAAARDTAIDKFDRAKGREAWISLLREMGLDIPAA
ncbi:glycosyltransferase [Phenylobacterium kunshanense]|uniref:Group 1 glycosyl transferase n=1 Tax=Phenylobacterium kunshanense TaxID=1445034 RepID=A0A328BMS0_9CAUL|nr:glycosyltransferase [Phenylobacterium kunshanense]RAK68660.1 group 1 glycosyl transferase [Phenylobacterium kunshanense]